LISIVTAGFALAQEPSAFAAMYPDRDVLNGAALTPAGRMKLGGYGGAAGLHAVHDARVNPRYPHQAHQSQRGRYTRRPRP
jgi:hypothetical protein